MKEIKLRDVQKGDVIRWTMDSIDTEVLDIYIEENRHPSGLVWITERWYDITTHKPMQATTDCGGGLTVYKVEHGDSPNDYTTYGKTW